MYNPLYLNDVIKSNEMKIISEYWKPSFMWASQPANTYPEFSPEISK